MYEKAMLRELLIQSCHSDEEANQFFLRRRSDADLLSDLIEIAKDDDSHGGDAPMQAAYFVSQFTSELLGFHADALVNLLPKANGYGGHVALALARSKSPTAKPAIEAQLGDGSRFDAWLFKQALSECEAI